MYIVCTHLMLSGCNTVCVGMRQKPSSPVPSPEKSSPNKSPPVQSIKGFNPNAPTFIPMAMQNQRPANVSKLYNHNMYYASTCTCTCRRRYMPCVCTI